MSGSKFTSRYIALLFDVALMLVLLSFTGMSAKAIQEATGKRLLNSVLGTSAAPCRFAPITESTNWDTLATEHPWLLTEVRIRVHWTRDANKKKFFFFLLVLF